MTKDHANELPIRSKLEMIQDIVQIINFLHEGERSKAEPLVEDLKRRAVFMDEDIQQKALSFVEQICFQYDYDRLHQVTPEVQKAADLLIEALGFRAPP